MFGDIGCSFSGKRSKACFDQSVATAATSSEPLRGTYMSSLVISIEVIWENKVKYVSANQKPGWQ